MESLGEGKYIDLESCIYNENRDAIHIYTTLQIDKETKAFTLYSEYGLRQPSIEYKGFANYEEPNVLHLDFKHISKSLIFAFNARACVFVSVVG